MLVTTHLPLVRRLILGKWGSAVRSHDLEDLVQAGSIGLIHAARRFDPSRGIMFSTFATPRIIGAAIDQIRICHGRRQQRLQAQLAIDVMGDESGHPMDCVPGDIGHGTDARVARVRLAVTNRLRQLFPQRTAQMALIAMFDRRPQIDVARAFGVTDVRASQILAPIRECVVSIIEHEIALEVAA